MNNISVTTLSSLKRDLALRGYNEAEVDEFLRLPVLLIPGPITPQDSDAPTQKLTSHLAFLSKDLQKAAIPNKVVLRKDIPRSYIEERHAHVDLGTIVVGLWTVQQLGAFANVAQILDFLLNLVQLKFGIGRTAELMPRIRFNLEVHNGDKMARLQVEGQADEVTKILTPSRVEAMLGSLQESSRDD